MRRTGVLCILAVTVLAAAAAAETTVTSARLDVIQTMLDQGKYDEAAEAARGLLRGGRDDESRTGALRIVAVALRKKGDWKAAAKAYEELKARFEKASAEYVIAEATAEVLQASPKGVYAPLAKNATAASGGGSTATLADDGALAKALVAVGDVRAAKVNGRLGEMKKSRSPREIVKVFDEMAQGFQQARILNPDLSLDLDRNAAQAAADALDRVEKDVLPALRQRMDEITRTGLDRGTLDNTQKDQVSEALEACQQASDAERAFRDVLKPIIKGWPEGVALNLASIKRGNAYGDVVRQCRLMLALAARGHRGRR